MTKCTLCPSQAPPMMPLCPSLRLLRVFKHTVHRVDQWCFQCLLCCWFVSACVSLLWWCSKYPMCYKQIHSWVDIWDCTLEIKCQTCVNTMHTMYIHTSSTIWAEKKGRSTCACTLASPGYAYCRATKGARDVWNICIYLPRKSKDQTLPIGNRESFTWIIPKTILCLVLDFQCLCLEYTLRQQICNASWHHELATL